MGYLHINNLYKDQSILSFRTCYALEKIHGTSAHVRWDGTELGFFSGGENHDRFIKLFDQEALTAIFKEKFGPEHATVYGEAYGGKQQGMSPTYGTELRFIAFDVKVGDSWLAVPQAYEVVTSLGLEFVDYAEVPTDIDSLNAERDKPSTQAVRNGIGPDKIREGVVLRPPFEVTKNNGDRVIVKHKRAEFAERGRPDVPLDPTKQELLTECNTIALEWVTFNRLDHVIDHIKSRYKDGRALAEENIPELITEMIEDVTREGMGEIVDNKSVRKAIGQRTVQIFKQKLREERGMG